MATVEALNKRSEHTGLIITADEMKANYLFGVDLSDKLGNAMPDSLLEFHIRAAQDWLQVEIPGLLICEQDVDEQQDFYAPDYMQYNFMKLYKFPAQSVSEISVTFPLATSPVIFDSAWYRLNQQGPQAMLVPTNGTFASLLTTASGAFVPFFMNAVQNVPLVWNIKYKAGFRKGKVPSNILEIIGMRAAIQPLSIAGDMILGAGISNKSLSLDGLSQSLGSTASSGSSGYGARIKQYNETIEAHLQKLRTYYGGINLVVC